MEKTPSIYETLYNVTDAEKAHQDLIAYIKSEALRLLPLSKETYKTAYRFAGLMVTDYVRGLPDDDPVVDVLAIAGELEINPGNARELADELVGKILSL